MNNDNNLIFELSKNDRVGYSLPKIDVEMDELENLIPGKFLRKEVARLPEVSEVDIIRHYTNLSKKNYGVDDGMYPLGSCTMKYNPKINENIAKYFGFSSIHPLQHEKTIQGCLEVIYELEKMLCEITGMDEYTLQPAAGAHGEMLGLMIIKAYHENRNDKKRTKIIVPDSAHGTNPASVTSAGLEIIEIKSKENGRVDIEKLKEVVNDETAGLMLTNPNTLGLFEEEISIISKVVHDAGGLLYYDGANLNAIMGITRPGDMGFDVMHVNLHKTFSTPHGGGGPGSGPVGVKKNLKEFLCTPTVKKIDDKFYFDSTSENSIGKIKGFYGNFLVYLRAYVYILTMGRDGLKKATEIAVLNANYLKERLKQHYYLKVDDVCKHEFVLGGVEKGNMDIKTIDVAKRLLDFGYHPPTVYFPLIVENAIMIEPTETESKETLDKFVEAMIQISKEAKENYDILQNAPNDTKVKRVDEIAAARNPVLKYMYE